MCTRFLCSIYHHSTFSHTNDSWIFVKRPTGIFFLYLCTIPHMQIRSVVFNVSYPQVPLWPTTCRLMAFIILHLCPHQVNHWNFSESMLQNRHMYTIRPPTRMSLGPHALSPPKVKNTKLLAQSALRWFQFNEGFMKVGPGQ